MIKKIFNLKFAIFKTKSKQAGFTVLESIVAIFILSLSIAGAFSAIQQNLSLSTISKDEVKAFYLAQEAVEIIRNKRDNNQLSKIAGAFGGDWLTGITDASNCPFNKVCIVDANPVPPTLTYCADTWEGCSTGLLQNQSTFIYNHDSGSATNFTRKVMIEPINANEVAVIVQIEWSKGLMDFKFKVKTTLMNWI